MFSLFSLLALPLVARAGSYNLAPTSYSGGIATNSHGSSPYILQGNGQWGRQNYTDYGAPPAAVTCSGVITAHFVWVPDAGKTIQTDPPPSQCLVKEECSVTWSGYQGSGTDGVGGPVTGNSSNGGQSGTGYSVKSNPGAGFDWPATGNPTVSVSVTPPSGGCNATLFYRASASTTTLSLGLMGTTPDSSGNLHILIGQKCSAGLSAGSSGATLSNIQWTVDGQTVRSTDWTVSADQKHATFVGPEAVYT